MNEWLIPLLSAVFGALVTGGGVTFVAKLALVQSLRAHFPDKEDVVSPLAMHERLGEHGKSHEARMQEFGKEMRAEFRAFLVEVREEFESKFTPTAARLEREHSALKADLDRAIGELRFASQQLTAEGQNGKEAFGEARLAVEKVEGLQNLFQQLSARVGRMEEDIKGIARLEETVDDLKKQIDNFVTFQMAEQQRRRGKGGSST